MKEFAQFVGCCLLGLLILFGVMWIAQHNALFMYKFFAPKQEQVRREVFEQTKAYRQGMIQELTSMQRDYTKADSTQKQALKSVILHRLADFPQDSLPPSLNAFISTLKSEEGM